MKEVGYELPVSKKGHVDPIRQLAGEVDDVCQKSDVGQGELAKPERKLEELRLEVQLLADDYEKLTWIHAQAIAKDE